MHNRTVKIKKNEKKKEKKCDSRVKIRKRWSRAKIKNLLRIVGGANRRMKGQRPDSIWSLYEVLYLFWNQKMWTLCSKLPSPEFPSLSQLVLMPIKLAYPKTRKKWILLRCLIFKEFIFPEKRPWKRATLFAQLNCEKQIF